MNAINPHDEQLERAGLYALRAMSLAFGLPALGVALYLDVNLLSGVLDHKPPMIFEACAYYFVAPFQLIAVACAAAGLKDPDSFWKKAGSWVNGAGLAAWIFALVISFLR